VARARPAPAAEPVAELSAAPAPAQAAPTPSAPAASSGLPKVQPYQLPLQDLEQVASASGLQWVNSDAQKIAATQAAMAAEPKPAHVPRERPPAVVIDEGPLVLVETRRDLSELKLPFESGAQVR
jgi:ribonuclease E